MPTGACARAAFHENKSTASLQSAIHRNIYVHRIYIYEIKFTIQIFASLVSHFRGNCIACSESFAKVNFANISFEYFVEFCGPVKFHFSLADKSWNPKREIILNLFWCDLFHLVRQQFRELFRLKIKERNINMHIQRF